MSTIAGYSSGSQIITQHHFGCTDWQIPKRWRTAVAISNVMLCTEEQAVLQTNQTCQISSIRWYAYENVCKRMTVLYAFTNHPQPIQVHEVWFMHVTRSFLIQVSHIYNKLKA